MWGLIQTLYVKAWSLIDDRSHQSFPILHTVVWFLVLGGTRGNLLSQLHILAVHGYNLWPFLRVPRVIWGGQGSGGGEIKAGPGEHCLTPGALQQGEEHWWNGRTNTVWSTALTAYVFVEHVAAPSGGYSDSQRAEEHAGSAGKQGDRGGPVREHR